VNNQIGFTTNPVASRSTPYATDIAKGFQAPIFHVNGDDPEAVIWVADIAARYRHRFRCDVVIDLFCYRRHGHNEGDEPKFTQPLMYKAIQKHPTTLQLYRTKLEEEGVLSAEEADREESDFRSHLEKALELSETYKPNKADWLEGKWTGISQPKESERHDDSTEVPLDILRRVGLSISRIPDGVNVNPKLLRQLQARQAMIENGEGIDWSTAEALALGTLVLEGTQVRLSGQDSARGTFSQRHSAIVDQENERRYYPLSEIAPGAQANFEVMDSPLSEFGVLGFEYGYSLADPYALVLWEAQFGDFANGAQTIFDQFISSGESKWLRMSGLVVLLPHGYEGQGPEHSSARLDRFLQACAQDNMQVVNCTTPANYFHVLRRQVRRNFRKPLVVMTPKSLLRHKLVTSTLDEMGEGSDFRRVIGEIDPIRANEKVRRVVLCSGKVYYDLLEERRKKEIDDIAILRVEQFYPWPRDLLTKELGLYPNVEVVWCQEEPANMGGWTFIMRRIEYILEELNGGAKKDRRPVYVGRAASASPATGSLKTHTREQELLVTQALTWEIKDLQQPFQGIEE
jgi:2-oxoglutarate dehydrogenase E1 component